MESTNRYANRERWNVSKSLMGTGARTVFKMKDHPILKKKRGNGGAYTKRRNERLIFKKGFAKTTLRPPLYYLKS